MASDSVTWEPPMLAFPIAVNKVAVQQLQATNRSASTAFTFKVKTTNPKRYSVRPNVGVMWPGETAEVTVQLPIQRDLPSDISKCKDKFQVLTMPLSEQQANELLHLPSDDRRIALTDLWSGEVPKDVIVDKIKCTFVLDGTRSDPIPEEGPVTPYTPEANATSQVGAQEQGVQDTTPLATSVVGTPLPAITPDVDTNGTRIEPATTPAMVSEDVRRLLAADRDANAEDRREMMAELKRMRDMLKEQQLVTSALQARLEAQQTNQRQLQSMLEKHSAPQPPAPAPGMNPMLLIAFGAMVAMAIAAAFGVRMERGIPEPPPLPSSMIREEL